MRAGVAVLALLLCVGAARAEPGAAAFAGAQLDMARAALDQARQAFDSSDYASARRLAEQAGLDARLAFGMTESDIVRRTALQIGGEAEWLRSRGISAGAGLIQR